MFNDPEDSPMKMVRQPHCCMKASSALQVPQEVEVFLELAQTSGLELRVEACCEPSDSRLRFLCAQCQEVKRRFDAWNDKQPESPDLITKLATCHDTDLLLSPSEAQQLVELLTRLLRRRKRLSEGEARLSGLAVHLDSKMQEVQELQTYLADVLTDNEALRRENADLTQRLSYFKQAFEEMGSTELSGTSGFPNLSFSSDECVLQEKGNEKENEPPEKPRHRHKAPTFSSGDFQCLGHEEPKRS